MKKIVTYSFVVLILVSLVAGQALYAGSQDGSLSGKVIETMNSGGYSYACIEKNGKKTWVAVPQMKIVKGQNISFQPGVVMENFKSKTLNRTFDSIIFSGGPAK